MSQSEQWEVVSAANGVRSHFNPGTFPNEQEAIDALVARECYVELWRVRRVPAFPLPAR